MVEGERSQHLPSQKRQAPTTYGTEVSRATSSSVSPSAKPARGSMNQKVA
jgi:hypothetical protein